MPRCDPRTAPPDPFSSIALRWPCLNRPERLTQTFRLWRPQDQEAFLDLNADVVERWIAARAAQNRKRA